MTEGARFKLKFYGFGSFSALIAIAPFLGPPSLMYLAFAAALGGGALGLVGHFWPKGKGHLPALVFVSTGGTCRDPMEMVIMERILAAKRPDIRVYAAGLGEGTQVRASKAARHVVKEKMGADLLQNHQRVMLDHDMISNAGLILAMTDDHVNTIKKLFPEAASKTYNLLNFVGRTGEIRDPYHGPDAMDEATLARYRSTFDDLNDVLTKNCDRIISAVVA